MLASTNSSQQDLGEALFDRSEDKGPGVSERTTAGSKLAHRSPWMSGDSCDLFFFGDEEGAVARPTIWKPIVEASES